MTTALHRAPCSEEEDFVKSFLPSLFDSDSDADETFPSLDNSCTRGFSGQALQVHLGKPLQKTTSSEAFSKVQTYNKPGLINTGLLSIKEDVIEATSPSSQGNSNTSTQTPFSGGLEHSDSLDSDSPFYSVLSFESSDTAVLDFHSSNFSEARSPAAKRQKIQGSMTPKHSPMNVSCANSNKSFSLREASPANSIVSAHSMPSPARLAPALMPRHSLPALPVSQYSSCGVTTGIPVDSFPLELSRSWASPQAMIPTNPPASAFAGHFGSHIPSNLPAPVTSNEKIAAALLDIKDSPSAALPLGLNLDLSSVAQGMHALGMVLKD